MNLGHRCQRVLPNSCQCPNTAIDGMQYCLLCSQLTSSVDETNINEATQPSTTKS